MEHHVICCVDTTYSPFIAMEEDTLKNPLHIVYRGKPRSGLITFHVPKQEGWICVFPEALLDSVYPSRYAKIYWLKADTVSCGERGSK
jgi:hypothetical protein